MGKETGMKETVDNVLDDIAAKRAAASEKAGQENRETSPKKEFKEITMKFGKGCVGEEFQGKDGNKYKEILVPNPDKNDHRPWQTFVVKANHVHEDKFGKGMWIKLPAEGHTTLRRPVVVGEKPDGKKEWGTEKNSIANADLKKMVEAYKERPVADIAEKDCALFLWVTFPCLLEGFEVIRAWGFTYKTVAFVWVKQNKKSDSLFWGMGYWTRSNVELCILATKGSPKRVDAGVHQVVVSHIEEHSRKPGEVHERIRRLMGDVPKIELFARRKAEGFDVWGNEVDSDIEFKGGNRLCS